MRATDPRITTNDAYLEPARGRPNLRIIAGALVYRLEWVGQRCVGVRVVVGNEVVRYTAGEVVLCARAIHSPAILLRSGVGPFDVLRSFGIAPVVELSRVGQNLCEQPLVEIGLGNPSSPAKPIAAPPFGCVLRAGSGAPSDDDLSMFSAENWVSPSQAPAFWVGFVDPRSRGRLRLRSSDPFDDPWLEFDCSRMPRIAHVCAQARGWCRA